MKLVAAVLGLGVLALVAFSLGAETRAQLDAKPVKTETLKCVRVKEVSADAQIIYKCEVPK